MSPLGGLRGRLRLRLRGRLGRYDSPLPNIVVTPLGSTLLSTLFEDELAELEKHLNANEMERRNLDRRTIF